MEQGMRIGLGMYTVHRAAQENLEKALTQLARIGYQGIEFYGEPSEYPAETVRKALGNSGLSITGWHIEWNNLQEDTMEDTMRFMQEAGCGTAVIPCLGGKWNIGHAAREDSRDRWLYYAQRMNRISRRMEAEGLRLGYHNHEHEFLLQYEGQRVFDLLFENLAPEVVMELDSGNCIEGGDDPVRVLQAYAGRPVLLHLKPYSPERGFHVVLGEAEDANDWHFILHQPGAEPQWLLVESENELLPEMENAERCFEGLRTFL